MNLSLKRSIISSLLILFLAFIFTAFAQENSGVSTVPISPAPYKVGERLTYNVSFSNFPSAAHVEIQVVSRGVYFGRDAFQLHAHVETTGVINVALFSINNDYTTYVDAASGFPFRVQQVVRDATKPADTFHDFNQPAGTIARSKQRAIVGTYDLLAAFYRARALPLTDGSPYTFLVRTEAAEYTAELKVVGRESVRTNVGSFNSIVAQIRVGNNSPIKDLKIYFTDDELHVPVLISARVSTGDPKRRRLHRWRLPCPRLLQRQVNHRVTRLVVRNGPLALESNSIIRSLLARVARQWAVQASKCEATLVTSIVMAYS